MTAPSHAHAPRAVQGVAAKMRVLDLFAGLGGMSLGLERTGGFVTVAFCEIEPFPQRVLKKHWPDVPCHSDVRALKGDDVGPVDVICGGYPCQPFSYAGKREGADDDRHLWPHYLRLITELRPAWVIGENVAGHITLGLDQVLSDLESAGYAARAFVIPAVAVDAPHRRDRVWIVANATGLQRDGSREHRQSSVRQVPQSGKRSGPQSVANAASIGQSGPWQPVIASDCATGGKGKAVDAFASCLGSVWGAEPDVGRVVARVSNGLDGGRLNGEASNGGTGKILRAMQRSDGSETIKWPSRGFGGIQSAEVLFSTVREYAGSPKPLGNVSLESKKASSVTVRGVWFNGKTACSSCRRSAEKQRCSEHTDAVHLLSQLLACNCGSTWLDPTGTPSETRGVDRLKALGNSVVPQIPELIGRAILAAQVAA
jgi:DNA (cytosine-5)-methyltransferase 1